MSRPYTFTVTPAMVNEFRVSYNGFSPQYQVENGFSLHDLGGDFPVLNNVPIPPKIVVTSLGRITSAGSARVGQFALKILY